MTTPVARLWHEALAAGVLLTRLPLGGLVPAAAWPADGRCVWAYPLVGLLVGGLAAVVHAGLAALALPEPLPALWTLAATVLLTGGLHEDGLADAADGLGGGASVSARLAIMRDSRIGSFGATALVLALGLRVAAIAALGPRVVPALLASAVLGRAAMLVVLALLPPARRDGVAAGLAPGGTRLLAGMVLSLTPLLLLPPRVAAAGLATAVAAALAAAWIARRLLGGHTGDVLGAAEQLAECATLSALCAGLA